MLIDRTLRLRWPHRCVIVTEACKFNLPHLLRLNILIYCQYTFCIPMESHLAVFTISTVLITMYLVTRTFRACPNRVTRPIACDSTLGFH